jgi:hypothetical protein
MIGSNSGDFVCTQVLHNLWKLYLCKKYMIKNRLNDNNQRQQQSTSNKTSFSYYKSNQIDDYDSSREDDSSSSPTKQQPTKRVISSSKINNNSNKSLLRTRDDIEIRNTATTTTTSSSSSPIKNNSSTNYLSPLSSASFALKPSLKNMKIKNSKLKKKTLFAKLFPAKPPQLLSLSSRASQPSSSISNNNKHSEEFNNEIRRFQSIKRVNIVRRPASSNSNI